MRTPKRLPTGQRTRHGRDRGSASVELVLLAPVLVLFLLLYLGFGRITSAQQLADEAARPGRPRRHPELPQPRPGHVPSRPHGNRSPRRRRTVLRGQHRHGEHRQRPPGRLDHRRHRLPRKPLPNHRRRSARRSHAERLRHLTRRCLRPHLRQRIVRQQNAAHQQGRPSERGSATAFVVVLATCFILLGGLIYDAGLAMAAKTSAITEAQQAARTAAQALNPEDLRDGTLATTPAQAEADAQHYLAATGDTGTVQLDGNQITVTVQRHQRTAVLGLVGINQLNVTGTATIQIEQGITSNTKQGPDTP